MDSTLYNNKQALIKMEHALALNKLELERLLINLMNNKKYKLHNHHIQISKNRISIKQLEIKNAELEIQYHKEMYLKDL